MSFIAGIILEISFQLEYNRTFAIRLDPVGRHLFLRSDLQMSVLLLIQHLIQQFPSKLAST